MAWLVVYVLLTVIGALGTVVQVNRLRYARRVARELRVLLAAPAAIMPRSDSGALPHPAEPGSTTAEPASAVELPPVVERYRQLAVGDRAPVGTLRLRHGGTFRMSPTSKASPIEGTQVFTADPPGFLWTGRIRMAPGLWVDARDMAVAGMGSMRVLLDDTVTLADAHGPEIDQGSALRLLAELVWLPTALFDGRTVTWSAIDAAHARATLRTGDHAVAAVFEFGADGLPVGVTAERFIAKGELRPWRGVYRDWRIASGMRVPFEAEVRWELPAGTYSYAHWLVTSLEYDARLAAP